MDSYLAQKFERRSSLFSAPTPALSPVHHIHGVPAHVEARLGHFGPCHLACPIAARVDENGFPGEMGYELVSVDRL